ncbi:MAG: hypothetical protein M3387_11905 [Actinomycetota bacterium]|nr:hypothetical protein [Actinomycetota bacterium]
MANPEVSIRELRPLRRQPLAAATLLRRRRNLPEVDALRLREDLDAVIDPSL